MKPADSSCPYGLACRVTAIANGLSRYGRIAFRWIENAHCPASLESVFPNGIDGVEFEKTTDDFETVFFDGRQANCWWKSGGYDEKTSDAYARVMDAMTGASAPNPPSVAILGRFHTNPAGLPEILAAAAIEQARNIGTNRVFVLSDKFRFEISMILNHSWIAPVLPKCPPLPVDLLRTANDVIQYISDWKTMLSAKVIVALDGHGSALHPAMAAGILICRVKAV